MKPRLKLALIGGRAELRRAPIDDFVFLLSHFQELVVDLGRSLAGSDVPDDVVERSCRLEIVGLSYGSLVPELELASFTEDEPNPIGLRAMEEVSKILYGLRDESSNVVPGIPPEVVTRVDRIGELLDRGYSRIDIVYSHNDHQLKGVVDETLRARLLSEQASAVTVEDVAVRGLLFALEDRPGERERATFGATLLDDAGQLWSVRFSQQDTDDARRLWKHKVQLTGTARYSKARRPLIIVERGEVVSLDSWEEALTRYHGSWKDLYKGVSFEDVIRDLR